MCELFVRRIYAQICAYTVFVFEAQSVLLCTPVYPNRTELKAIGSLHLECVYLRELFRWSLKTIDPLFLFYLHTVGHWIF